MLSRVSRLFAICATLFVLFNPVKSWASVMYEFTLPANGDVGAITIDLTLPTFLAGGSGLQVYTLDDAAISFTVTPTIDAAISLFGIDVQASQTLIGIQLIDAASAVVLSTSSYPGDFFPFSRAPTDVGTFGPVSGNVISDLTLDTLTPNGTLIVTSTNVPEPASLLLLAAGLAGVGFSRRKSA